MSYSCHRSQSSSIKSDHTSTVPNIESDATSCSFAPPIFKACMIYPETVPLPTLPKSNKGRAEKKTHNVIASLNAVLLQLTINLSWLIGERSKCRTLLKDRMQNMGWTGRAMEREREKDACGYKVEYWMLKWCNLPRESKQEEDWWCSKPWQICLRTRG